ncbi:MAG: hypothetical protein D6811_05485 [Alphaproteobacteria bacterium]|nr:MAG: hypothetical protein D6811_05485 [Alphaproteobacteria bacterium]
MRLRLLPLIIWLCAGAAAAETLRLGTDGDFPPNVTTRADGTLEGFEPELAALMCPLAGYDCRWVVMPFDRLERALLAREIDAIMAGMGRTSEREARMAFTTPYLAPTVSLFMVREGSEIELSRARIAAQAGSHQAAHVQAIGAGLVATDSFDAALAALREGRAEALLATRTWLSRQNTEGLVTTGPEVITSKGAAIALRPEDTEILRRLDTALATLEGDGRLSELRRKWFGKD